MAVELEAKLAVDSHDEVRVRLPAVGADRMGFVLETNAIFDSASRSLLANDEGLRVRGLDVIDGPARPATLTYKGPKRPGPLKQREEIEVSISDAQAARSLLVALGFVEALTFQKRRETWALDECHIELDELPHLGHFVEVEGPDGDAVHGVLERLGLSDRPIIKTSYIALLIDHCRRHDLPTERIEFPSD